MTKHDYTYWKAGIEAGPGEAISGCCQTSALPSQAIVGEMPLPRDIAVHREADGTILALSPPIIGPRYAYRYKLHLAPSEQAAIATAPDATLASMLRVLTHEAPLPGASRENWWWYAEERFTSRNFGQAIPVTLARKWKRGMLELLLETHPDRDQKLDEWDRQLENHKQSTRSRSTPRTSAHKKAHGDPVVLPHPVEFQTGSIKQIFSYDIEPASFGRRARHSLRLGDTRYRTKHGDATTFKGGTPAIDGLSLPIRAAMLLLAYARTPIDSHHAVLSAMQSFEGRTRDILEELEQDIARPRNGNALFVHSRGLAAARSALHDFPIPPVPEDAPASRRDMAARIARHYEAALSLLESASEEIPEQTDRAPS